MVAQEKSEKAEKPPKEKTEKKKRGSLTDTETRKLNIKRYLKLGDRFYAESAYYTAAEYYKEVVLAKPENRYANYWLAMSLLMSRDYEKAEVFFQKFGSIKPGEKDKESRWKEEDEKLFDKYHFFYAQALHRNGKYEEAIKEYSRFKGVYNKEDKAKWVKLANNGIKGCELGLNPHTSKIKVARLSTVVNRSYNELSPTMYDETTMYFSSLPSDTLIFDNKRKQRPEYRIYTASLSDGSWSKPTAVKNEEVNTPKYNVGNGAFNPDKTRFYFTKCTDMEDDRSLCNIFVATVKGGKFSNVTRLPEPVNYKEKFTSTQPTVRVGTDGREIVYFVSDREGGKGGLDIWFTSRIKSGEYTAPKLVGGPINTPGDEVTPFWDETTQTLYFSSNGHPGFGGFDVFATKETPDLGWEEPRNLGKNLNTGYDELYYNINSDQTRGFFTSNRPGGRALNGIASASDDIFTWEVFNYAVEGMAFKEGDMDAGSLEGAVFKLYRKNPDGSRELIAVDSSSKEGKYFFKLKPDEDYEVEAVRPGFKPTVEFVSTKDLPMEDTINKNIGVRKSAYVVYGEVTEEGKPQVKLDDVVFTIIELSGSGVQRTIGTGKTNVGELVYAVDLDRDKDYKIVFRKNGYFSKTVPFSTKGLGNKDSVVNNVALTKLELNKEYTLKNVLYEFGKATLTESSKEVLDTLYAILVENPTFVIELSSHTDAIGSDAANLKLSQARAESCVNYLISKGIAKDRLKPVGYGETKPKAPNQTEDGKDNPEGRALNRRTEFKILKN
jgi:outer membrane protein OmpA-like peptidoglycan-associated protein/tetratricopeptide (TPR) repeat protein